MRGKWRKLRTCAVVAVACLASPGRASAQSPAQPACTIPNSACYPWHIAAGETEAPLLDVIPNNAVTGAIYRVCLCAPGQRVELLFRFGDREVAIGEVASTRAAPICRDFRFETARRSRLVLRRAQGSSAPLAGCYVTAPVVP